MRAYAVVLGVALAPVALIAAAHAFGTFEAGEMQRRVARAADAVAGPEARATEATVRAAAAREGARVRLIDAAGRTLLDADYDNQRTLRDRLGDAFFGPAGAPTLRAFEATQPPLAARDDVADARARGRGAACRVGLSGELLVCSAAARVASAGDARYVYAQRSSPRAIRALFDMRYPLAKLTAYVLVVGLALGLWLGRRLVRPVEKLRDEVLARVDAPAGSPLIPEGRRDEVGDLARAFNALLRSLAERARANETFAADLVHELKSPLAAIRAAAESLESGAADAARALRLARVLADSSQRLDQLASRFLAIARAEAGLPGEPRAPLDADALVQGLCDALARDARYQGVRFETALAGPRVRGSASHLEGALRNVLDNAASFAGASGFVRARACADAGDWVLTVEDSGPGIAPEDLARVFERFYTLRGGDARGTGLGLALARAVIEAHGGAITAASEPGRGAVFTVRLPGDPHGVHTDAPEVSPGR